MRSFRWLALPVALGAIVLGLGACGGGSSSAKGIQLNASEKEFTITLPQDSVKSGSQKFVVHNAGTTTHEFVVFKTDLDPDKLPKKPDGSVDEEGAGVQHIDEIGDIAVGATKSLNLRLAAGHYVIICNLPGHYMQGMHVPLTVV